MIAADFAVPETFAFVDAAVAAGDGDAAIAALDQLLIRYPDNTDAHLRIANLYDAAGNGALAEVHRDLAGVPPRTQVWGRATAGIAHETNPTASPSSSQVTVFDGASNSFQLVGAGAERSDQAATVTVALNLAHGLSEEALLAAELFVSAEKFSASQELDSIRVQATVGPWMSVPGLGEGARIRPFVTGGSGMLDSAPYYGSIGAGVSLDLPVGDGQGLGLLADVTYTDFSGAISPDFDVNTLDNIALRTGAQFSGETAGIGYALYAYGGYTFADADEESYLSVRSGLFATSPIDGVAEALGVPVVFRLGGTADAFFYREPSPQFDPTKRRQDLWLGGQASVILGLSDEIDLTLGADFIRRFSNLDVFDSQSLRVFVEAGVSF